MRENAVVLASIALLFICNPCMAKPINKQSPRSTQIEQDDFSSSARDDVALGPEIKYPKRHKRFSSSSERYFTGGQINNVPFSSPGEALEIVPGLAVGR